MALVPRSTVGRIIAGVYVLACVGMLLFAWVQRGIHDMPVAFTWLMMFLTAPVGFLVAPAVGTATSVLSNQLGIAYDPFLDLVPMWAAMTLAGYAQWFIGVRLFWNRYVAPRAI